MEEKEQSPVGLLRGLASVFTEARLLAVFVVGLGANQGITALYGPIAVRDEAEVVLKKQNGAIEEGTKNAVKGLAEALNNHANHINNLNAQELSNAEVLEKLLSDAAELRQEVDEIGAMVETLRILAERSHGRRAVGRLVEQMAPEERPPDAATVKLLPPTGALVQKVPVSYDAFQPQEAAAAPAR